MAKVVVGVRSLAKELKVSVATITRANRVHPLPYRMIGKNFIAGHEYDVEECRLILDMYREENSKKSSESGRKQALMTNEKKANKKVQQ